MKIHSIDRELDEAAEYALKILHKEKKKTSKRKKPIYCTQGCCIWTGARWEAA